MGAHRGGSHHAYVGAHQLRNHTGQLVDVASAPARGANSAPASLASSTGNAADHIDLDEIEARPFSRRNEQAWAVSDPESRLSFNVRWAHFLLGRGRVRRQACRLQQSEGSLQSHPHQWPLSKDRRTLDTRRSWTHTCDKRRSATRSNGNTVHTGDHGGATPGAPTNTNPQRQTERPTQGCTAQTHIEVGRGKPQVKAESSCRTTRLREPCVINFWCPDPVSKCQNVRLLRRVCQEAGQLDSLRETGP